MNKEQLLNDLFKVITDVVNAHFEDTDPVKPVIEKGFRPLFYPTKDNMFQVSQFTVTPTWQLTNDGSTYTIFPDIRSWDEVNWNANVLVFSPGDYTHLKELKLKNLSGKTLICLTGTLNEHPVTSTLDRCAVIEAIELWECNDILLSGLTFMGKNNPKLPGYGMPNKIVNSNKIIVNRCHFQGVGGAACIRVYDSNFCNFQNSTFFDAPKEVGSDMGGIGLYASTGNVCAGNVISDCEFRNLTDAVGVVKNTNTKGFCPGTIIDNNDMYITEDYYTPEGKACAEDGADIKNGGTNELELCLFTNNRIWGHRPTDQTCGGSGSPGTGLVLHRDAQYWEISENIIFNTCQGISVFPPKFADENTGYIAIHNNLIFDMVDTLNNTEVTGIALRMTTDDVTIEDNTFINYPRLVLSKKDLKLEDRNIIKEGNKDYSFYIKRWSGPQLVTIKNALTTK